MSSEVFKDPMAETTREKHEELKRRLASGEYRTLIDVILDGTGRALQKLARQPQSVSFWYSAAIICSLVLVTSLVISAILGEYQDMRWRIFRIEVLGVLLAFASLVIFKLYIGSVFTRIRNHILDTIISEANLADFRRWLGLFCNVKLQLIFCLIYGLTLGLYTADALSDVQQGFIGYGPTVTSCLVAFIWGIPMYFLFAFLVLPARLSQYDYRLYKADPSSSEAIAHLSDLLGGLVYLYGIVAMGSMIYLTYAGLLLAILRISIIVAWLPITLLFLTGQYALRRIITRGKRVALSEIQARIDRIQAEEELAEKETMEKVIRLMDYHDRVKGTKNTALSIRSGLDFLNSLLLPVAGSILGNVKDFVQVFQSLVGQP